MEEAVNAAWEELSEYPLDEAVASMFQRFSDVAPDELERILYELVGKEGWKEASKGIPSVTYAEDSPFYGCQTDYYGHAIDPFTQQRISPEHLISYVSGGKKWCFDVRTLHHYWVLTGSSLNPFNRELMPESITNELLLMGKDTEYFVKRDNETRRVRLPMFVTYGDVIIGIQEKLLEDIIKYDVVSSDGKSLYELPLTDESVEKTLRLLEFGSRERRDECLLLLFRFCKRMSGTVHATLQSYLGALLGLVPVFADRDVPILRTDSVGDVIVKALLAYGGYHLWKVMDIVANGVSLYENNLNDFAVDVAPGLLLNVVPFRRNVNNSKFIMALVVFAKERRNNDFIEALRSDSITLDELVNNIADASDYDVAMCVSEMPAKDHVSSIIHAILSVSGTVSYGTAFRLVQGLSMSPYYSSELADEAMSHLNLLRVSPSFDWSFYTEYLGRSDVDAEALADIIRSLSTGRVAERVSDNDLGFFDDIEAFKLYFEGRDIMSIVSSSLIVGWKLRKTNKILSYVLANGLVSLEDVLHASSERLGKAVLSATILYYSGARDAVADTDKLEQIRELISGGGEGVHKKAADLIKYSTDERDCVTMIEEICCPECVTDCVAYAVTLFPRLRGLDKVYRMFACSKAKDKLFVRNIIDRVSAETVREHFNAADEGCQMSLLDAIVRKAGRKGLIYPKVTEGLLRFMYSRDFSWKDVSYFMQDAETQEALASLVSEEIKVLVSEPNHASRVAEYLKYLGDYGAYFLFQADTGIADAIEADPYVLDDLPQSTSQYVRESPRIQEFISSIAGKGVPVTSTILSLETLFKVINDPKTTPRQFNVLSSDESYFLPPTERIIGLVAEGLVHDPRIATYFAQNGFVYYDSRRKATEGEIKGLLLGMNEHDARYFVDMSNEEVSELVERLAPHLIN